MASVTEYVRRISRLEDGEAQKMLPASGYPNDRRGAAVLPALAQHNLTKPTEPILAFLPVLALRESTATQDRKRRDDRC